MPSGSRWQRQAAGFTYLGLMLFIAISGIVLSGAGLMWHTEMKRERERQLLFVGEEFRAAIVSYYENSPQGARQFPLRLEDLLRDNRFPVLKRHLRRMYPDPMSGSDQWGLVQEGGRIVGVYSLSEAPPLKKAGFTDLQEAFAKAESYREWQFVYVASAREENREGGGDDTVATDPAAVNEGSPIATTSSSQTSPPTPASVSMADKSDRDRMAACLSQRISDTSACTRYCAQNKSNPGNCSLCQSSTMQRYRACLGEGSLPALSMP